MPTSLTVDQLNAVAGNPGAAADYYGWSKNEKDPNYIFGNKALGRMQAGWSDGVTTGGNKQIHKILTGLGSKYGKKQAFVKAQPNVGNLFAEYFKTGKRPAELSPARAIQAYDYALRATGRDAVLDRAPGLLSGLVKGNIGSILGTAAGFAIPGIGPAIGGAFGGAIQGGVSDGFKGAALGGLSGYGIGSGANWLAGKAGAPFAVSNTPAPIVDKSSWVSRGNAVPGFSTGVTTPTGGGLVGAGALNSARIGIQGGASLGASPLAAFGTKGVTALPGVANLANYAGGTIPGTNRILGGVSSWQTPTNILGGANTLSNFAGLLGGATSGTALTTSNPDSFSTTGTTLEPISSNSGNPVEDRFNYALSDALTGNAGQTQNALARSGMGAGKISLSPRDLQRQAGYHTRPIGNFLAR